MSIPMFRALRKIQWPAVAAALVLGVSGCSWSSAQHGEAQGDANAMGADEASLISAEAVLQVLRIDGMLPPEDGEDTGRESVESLLPRIRTECNNIRSDVMIQRLLQTEEVRATFWYQQQADNAAAQRDLLAHVLDVAHIRDTTLIRVSATTASADDALTILRAWVEVYLSEVASRAEARYAQDRSAFQRQLEAVETEIDNVEARLRRHLIEHPIAQTTERMDVTQQELLFLNSKKQELESLLVAAVASHRALTAADAEAYEPTPDEVEAINLSRSVMELDAQIRHLRVTREALIEGGRDESHQEIRQIDDQIAAVESERQAEYDSQVRTLFNARLELAGMALSIYQEQVDSFTPRLEELQTRLEDLQAATDAFQQLQRELERLESQREQARKVMQDLDLLIRRAGSITLELHSPPTIVEP